MSELQRLQELENVSVSGTCAVSYYLSAGSNINLARTHIANELKTASNIKDKNVGKSVAAALRSLTSALKTYKELPINGLALFAVETSYV